MLHLPWIQHCKYCAAEIRTSERPLRSRPLICTSAACRQQASMDKLVMVTQEVGKRKKGSPHHRNSTGEKLV